MKLTRTLAALAMSIWMVSAQADFDTAVHAYFEGDYQSAMRELRPLARRGDIYAQLYVGLMYYHGRGVVRDYDRAQQWLHRPARHGLTSAQSALARMYEHGRGVSRNPAAAAEWYRRAAHEGSPVAQHKLGTLYRHGRGVEKDREEALKWFRRAAEQGSIAAQLTLARMLAEEGASVEAERWFAHLEARGFRREEVYVIDM